MQRDDFLRWSEERRENLGWVSIPVLGEEGEQEGRGKRGRGG